MHTLKKRKKIAVFLPIRYLGGSLNAAKNMAKMLHLGSRQDETPATVVFSCLAGAYNLEKDFADLLSLGIEVRETVWEKIATRDIQSTRHLKHANYDPAEKYHQYPTDGATNFEDCDHWLIISDRTVYPLLAVKPYGIVVYDYIQRYVPEMFGGYYESPFLSTTVRAQFVLTTTPQTREDAIQYVGLNANKVHLLPMEFNPFNKVNNETNVDIPTNNYFLWTTNCAVHKNHLVALDALAHYYETLDGKLLTCVTDPTGLFSQAPISYKHTYQRRVRKKINNHVLLKKHMHMLGYLNQEAYLSLLLKSTFVWHPTRVDNGTFSVVEAGYHGVPALSSDYPQMRYIDDRFKLNMKFFDATDPIAMASALKEMEQQYKQQVNALPDKHYLDQFTYQQLALDVWQQTKRLL